MAPTQQQSKETKAKLLSGAKKSPKARITRYIKKHVEAQIEEGPKSILLLQGIRCSHAMSTVLRDLRATMAPHAKLLSKNNLIVPFQEVGTQSIEFLTTKNDCSLFALASHNKKRPNHLTIGRTFDRRILDMVELNLLRYKSIQDSTGVPKKRLGSKPMILFMGDTWHLHPQGKRLQNLFLDFYRGEPVKSIVLSGLDHLIVLTASNFNHSHLTTNPTMENGMLIHQRTYFCKLKKDPLGGQVPVPFLIPCGPDMDVQVRRTQLASADVWKQAMKQPIANTKKKVKNQKTTLFGETLGRLHMEKQNLEKVGGRKSKVLRKAEKLEKEEQKAEIMADLEKEKVGMKAEMKQIFGFTSEE